MTYKTILAAVNGGTASSGVMELASRLAQRFDAHLEGFHVRINPAKVLTPAVDGGGIPLPTDSVEDIAAEAAATAAKTKTAFDACIARHRLAQADAPGRITASTTWREETGAASDMLSRRARFFDLVVLGHSTRRRPSIQQYGRGSRHTFRPSSAPGTGAAAVHHRGKDCPGLEWFAGGGEGVGRNPSSPDHGPSCDDHRHWRARSGRSPIPCRIPCLARRRGDPVRPPASLRRQGR